MAKTNLKAVKDDKAFCELTLDQIDEVNQKIHITLSTLDVFKTIDATSLNEHSLSTLAQEAAIPDTKHFWANICISVQIASYYVK